MCQNRSVNLLLILRVYKFLALLSLHNDFVELDKMQVNRVEHDLRRIEQIDLRLYNDEDTCTHSVYYRN